MSCGKEGRDGRCGRSRPRERTCTCLCHSGAMKIWTVFTSRRTCSDASLPRGALRLPYIARAGVHSSGSSWNYFTSEPPPTPRHGQETTRCRPSTVLRRVKFQFLSLRHQRRRYKSFWRRYDVYNNLPQSSTALSRIALKRNPLKVRFGPRKA